MRTALPRRLTRPGHVGGGQHGGIKHLVAAVTVGAEEGLVKVHVHCAGQRVTAVRCGVPAQARRRTQALVDLHDAVLEAGGYAQLLPLRGQNVGGEAGLGDLQVGGRHAVEPHQRLEGGADDGRGAGHADLEGDGGGIGEAEVGDAQAVLDPRSPAQVHEALAGSPGEANAPIVARAGACAGQRSGSPTGWRCRPPLRRGVQLLQTGERVPVKVGVRDELDRIVLLEGDRGRKVAEGEGYGCGGG